MTLFLKHGGSYSVTTKRHMDIHEKLPVGNYILKFSQQSGFYLDITDDFSMPPKLYGKTQQHTDRILNTFNDRTGATGVLLSGEKGSGKSLLAKNLGIQSDAPVIIINQSYTGDDFNSFLQQIEQNVVVMMDEFEKVYSKDEDQAAILTLFDGVFSTNKLFLLTVNDSYKVNTFFHNRPSRIYYKIEFSSLDIDFIQEYAEDNLKSKEQVIPLVEMSATFGSLNFDMLKAVVEEMNRYNESPQAVLELLNVKQTSGPQVRYRVKHVSYEGKERQPVLSHVMTNLFQGDTGLYIKDASDDDGEIFIEFNMQDIRSVRNKGNDVLFVTESGNTLLLEKDTEKAFSYADWIDRVF